MEKNKSKEKNKFLKFLLVLKKFWYVVLISVLVFGSLGYFIGNKKSTANSSFTNKASNKILKANILISDANYKDFSDSFNNTCLYFMWSREIIKPAIKAVDSEIQDSEISNIISLSKINNITNMVTIKINYKSMEDAKLVLNSYLIEAQTYLNKTLKDNITAEGNFKDGTDKSNIIKLTQVGEIGYETSKEYVGEIKISILKYLIAGIILGIGFAVVLLYFWKFYFIIHSPVDVIKNFSIDYIGKFDNADELKKYLENNKSCVFFNKGKEKIVDVENCYTSETIFNNTALVEEKEVVVIIKEDKDSYFYIEKVQLLIKNKIRGFIIYK